jgi:tripartite-type tricarboxylate transporter receptor subunit TctC
MKRRTLLQATVASAATLSAPMIKAQSLPNGPIRIVVGFPPGGGTDALARVLAQKLQTMWGISIIIDNKAGAAGVIAADFVAKQPSDGNTLLMAHINSHALATSLQPKLGYNVERDFTPIGLVGVTPNLLICNESQPAKSVKDLVMLCKQNPGKISFASAGGGSAQHLALEMFKLRAGIDALHVPYKGSGPALTTALKMVAVHLSVLQNLFAAKPKNGRESLRTPKCRLTLNSHEPNCLWPRRKSLPNYGRCTRHRRSLCTSFFRTRRKGRYC